MDIFLNYKLSNFLQNNLKNAVNLIVLSSIASAQDDNTTTNDPTSFTCLPGQIFTGDACKVCDAGFYCDGNLSFPCPEGKFCLPGSLEPTQCPEGYFCPEQSWRPFDCPSGNFCENGVRKPCEPGFYNILTKQSECLVCDGGKFCENAALEPKDCPAGSFCLPMSVSPTLCPVGYWCPEKTFRPIDCPRDGICNEVGQEEPKFETTTGETTSPTTAGSTSPTTTGTTIEDDFTCNPGLLLRDVSNCPAGSCWLCKPCQEGYFCDGKHTATECPGGSFCVEGLTKDCPAGSFCQPLSTTPTICPVGYWCPAKMFRPIQCHREQVCDEEGLKGPKFVTTTEMTTEMTTKMTTEMTTKMTTEMTTERTTERPTTEFDFTCPLGQHRTIRGRCTFCPLGTAGTKSGICVSCPPGTFQSSKGSTTCVPCPAGNFCQTEGLKRPTRCPTGSISSDLAQTECKLCSGNALSNKDGTNCQVCPNGYFSDRFEGDFMPMAANLKNDENMSEKLSENSMKIMSMIQPGDIRPQHSCLPCGSGEFCKKGYRNVCPRGSYQNKAAQSECSACPRGYFCGTGSVSPLACSEQKKKSDRIPVECRNFFKSTHNGLGLMLHFIVE